MDLQKLTESKSATYIPGYAKSYPDKWEYFINFIDYCYKADWITQNEEERRQFIQSGRFRKGLLQIWGYFTMFAENPADRPDIVKNIDKLFNQIEADYGAKKLSSFAITNLSSAENVTNRHNDITNNFYVQCVGSVTWKIYDSISSSSYVEYNLSAGDAIFVPSGISHEVVALEPRAAVTVAFEGQGKNV